MARRISYSTPAEVTGGTYFDSPRPWCDLGLTKWSPSKRSRYVRRMTTDERTFLCRLLYNNPWIGSQEELLSVACWVAAGTKQCPELDGRQVVNRQGDTPSFREEDVASAWNGRDTYVPGKWVLKTVSHRGVRSSFWVSYWKTRFRPAEQPSGWTPDDAREFRLLRSRTLAEKIWKALDCSERGSTKKQLVQELSGLVSYKAATRHIARWTEAGAWDRDRTLPPTGVGCTPPSKKQEEPSKDVFAIPPGTQKPHIALPDTSRDLDSLGEVTFRSLSYGSRSSDPLPVDGLVGAIEW